MRVFRRALSALDAGPAVPEPITIRLEFSTRAALERVERWLADLARAFPGLDLAGSRAAAYVQTL